MAAVNIAQDGSAIVVTGGRGAARIRRLSRTVVEMTLSGNGEADLVPVALEQLRATRFDAGKLTLFVDLKDLASYSSEFRREWTLWLLNAAQDLNEVYVLGDPRAIFTAMPTTSVILSDLVHGVRDRDVFDRKKREAVWDN